MFNVYIIDCCMLTCFKEIYLSFPNVAGMEFALMYPAAPVELWKSGVYERVGVTLTHFGRFRRNKELQWIPQAEAAKAELEPNQAAERSPFD